MLLPLTVLLRHSDLLPRSRRRPPALLPLTVLFVSGDVAAADPAAVGIVPAVLLPLTVLFVTVT